MNFDGPEGGEGKRNEACAALTLKKKIDETRYSGDDTKKGKSNLPLRLVVIGEFKGKFMKSSWGATR